MTIQPRPIEAFDRLTIPGHVADIAEISRDLLEVGLELPDGAPMPVSVQNKPEAIRAYWELGESSKLAEYERLAINLGSGTLIVALEHFHENENTQIARRSTLTIGRGAATVYYTNPESPHRFEQSNDPQSLDEFRERFDHTVSLIGLSRYIRQLSLV